MIEVEVSIFKMIIILLIVLPILGYTIGYLIGFLKGFKKAKSIDDQIFEELKNKYIGGNNNAE